MNYQKQYADKINWKNSPDTSTPLNATNLNKMDNALWYMDTALYTISKAIGGGSSARGGIISNVGNNEFTTHVHQRTGESLANNELLILRSDVSGTGNSINVYTSSSSAVGFDLLDLDGESTSITVTTDSVVVLMITDADADYTAQVLAVIDTAGGVAYSGLGIGKKTGVSSNVIDTDIDLHRSPMAGDRLLVYFDVTVQNPTGLKTYNNGVAVTSNLENAIPLYINAGWNILEFKNDLLFNNVWFRKQNIPVPSTLAGMSDTLIVSPSDDQLLVYDNGKWKNKKFVEANVGFSDTELKKIKVGDVVFDADGLRDYSVSSIANNNITISVLNSNQFVMENIAINTGNHSGSSNGWNLVISDGMNPVSVALKNADGTVFADDIHENELLFVYVDTAGNVARVLEIHSHDLEVLKDICITEKTASGNPLTLTDALPYAALSLSADIVPIQDLHDLPFPYVGGAYKNKLPMTVAGIKAANTGGTWSGNVYTINGGTFTILTDSADNVTGIKINGTFSEQPIFRLGYMDFYANTAYTLNGAVPNTSNFRLAISTKGSDYGDGYTYTPTADDLQRTVIVYCDNNPTANNLVFKPMIRTSGDASYAPYSNICPISGRTAVELRRKSKNLFNGEYDYHSTTRYTPVNANTQYTISSKSTGDRHINLHYLYSDNTFGSNILVVNIGETSGSVTVTTPSNVKGIEIFVNGDATNTGNYAYDTQIELGDTVTTYEPYEGVPATIQLGQTVYGGTVNLVTGAARVDRAYLAPEDVENVLYDSGLGLYYWIVVNNISSINGANVISSHFESRNVAEKGCCYISGQGHHILVIPSDQTLNTKALASAWVLANSPQFVYKLATPLELTLTPTEVQMLKGYNQISSDGGGTIALTYKADRLAAIEAALAALQ